MNKAIKRRQRARAKWRRKCAHGKNTDKAWANYIKVKEETKGKFWLDIREKEKMGRNLKS